MPNNEWYTPDSILAAARAVLGDIDLDPASCKEAQKRVKARRYFTKEDDGLAHEWRGRVWLNPPFQRALIALFVAKLLAELALGRVTEAIMLVDNCADTKWFIQAARAAALVCFTHGRIRFVTPNGKRPGSPPKGQAILYFGANPDKFKEEFGKLGLVGRLQRRKSPSRTSRLRKFLLSPRAVNS